MSTSALDRFRLDDVAALVQKHSYKKVVLQFPDEELSYSVAVYDHLADTLPEDTDIYITADSTWGSSIDDVSAMHCDADVLVYFGTDLSSSGSLPVAICPPMKPLSKEHCQRQISSAISSLPERGNGASTVLFCEPGYYPAMGEIAAFIEQTVGSVHIAKLPPHADLSTWEPRVARIDVVEQSGLGEVIVGGQLVPADLIEDSRTTIVYVGDKTEQIVNIMLRASDNTVLHYSPQEATPYPTATAVRVLKGTEAIEFRERYVGVLRVKDARIVGIVVGSMGLTAELTKDLVHRLQTLIRAAHKRYYTFVMGRLNEAKLCNFPEVDVFCLVSNEDNANIKPKTFHKPVITPYELELGLGAREWNAKFSTDLGALVGNGAEDLAAAVERVRDENPGDGDSDSEQEGEGGETYVWSAGGAGGGAPEASAGATAGAGGCAGREVKDSCGCVGAASTAVVEHGVLGGANGGKGQLTVFHSAAAEYLQNREYKGLVREVEEGANMDIMPGQYGVAATYKVNTPEDAPKEATA